MKSKPKLNSSNINNNRIVRVRNEDIHDMLEFCANWCKVPYQAAFEEWCNLMTEGYTTGTHTNVMLVDRLKDRFNLD